MMLFWMWTMPPLTMRMPFWALPAPLKSSPDRKTVSVIAGRLMTKPLTPAPADSTPPSV
jgi:hypothetical protein